MAIAPGRHIGNFEVVRLIGEGGFGEVYEAANPLIQRRVAIKVLHGELQEDAELVRRFLNEARAASGIHHPNIVEVFDAGMTPAGEPYIVMEYLDGDPLQKVIADQGKLGLRVAQEIARQACSALGAAHATGIVHRDLKPENLFVLQHPEAPLGLLVKVLDFGIAKVKHRGEQSTTLRTRTGLIMGSPAYMSPEQCKDSSDVDHRSDIYSMGVIVYEMLAGRPPFSCESAADLLVMQVSSPPAALRAHAPDLPDYVEQAVMRALAKDRNARFDNVDYFVGALLGTYPARTAPGTASAILVDAQNEDASGSTAVAAGATAGNPRPARKSITTFGHTTGEATVPDEWGQPEPGRRSRAWTIAAVGMVVAIALGLGFLQLRRSGGDRSATQSPSLVPPPAAAPTPAMVHVRVSSVPAAATVVDNRDGTTLGETPLDKVLPKGNGTLALTVRLPGYQDESVALALAADASAVINLKAVAAEGDRKATPSTERARAKTAGKRPAKATPDEWVAH